MLLKYALDGSDRIDFSVGRMPYFWSHVGQAGVFFFSFFGNPLAGSDHHFLLLELFVDLIELVDSFFLLFCL